MDAASLAIGYKQRMKDYLAVASDILSLETNAFWFSRILNGNGVLRPSKFSKRSCLAPIQEETMRQTIKNQLFN